MEDTISILGKTEPWSNQIIPKEPDPYSFNTYSEYEKAYLNWGKVVIENTKKIPPHAKDFKQLHKITKSETKPQKNEKCTDVNNKEEEKHNEKINKGKVLKSSYLDLKKLNNFPHLKTKFGDWLFNYEKLINLQSPLTAFQSIEILHFNLSQNKYNQSKQLLYNNNFNINYIDKIYDFNFEKIINKYKKYDESNIFKSNSKILKKINNGNKIENEDTKLYECLVFFFNFIKGSITECLSNKSARILGTMNGIQECNNNKLGIKNQNGNGNDDNENENNNKVNDNKKILIYFKTLKNNYLRRNDILDGIFQLHNNYPKYKVEGEKIILQIPNYDLNESFDLNLISKKNLNSKKLISKYENQLKSNLNEYNENKLKLRHYPNKYSKSNIDNEFLKHDQIFNTINDKPKIEHILQILLIDCHLDIFKDWLKKKSSFKSKIIQNGDIFHSLINKSNIKKILDLFFMSNSKKIHSKIAYIISKPLLSSTGSLIIEYFFNNNNLKYLFSIIYALNYFEDENININLPYIDEELNYSELLCGFNSSEIEISIMKCFYNQQIIKANKKKQDRIKTKTNQVNLKKNNQLYSSILSQLLKQIQSVPEFLEEYIWIGYSSRSKRISNYYLLLIVILLNQNNETINRCFISPKVDLRNKLLQFMKTKYKHVKITLEILFKYLLKNDLILKYLINQYHSSPLYLISDLSPSMAINLNNSNRNKNNININNKKNNHNNNNNNNNNNSNSNSNSNSSGILILPFKSIFCYLILKASCNKYKTIYLEKVITNKGVKIDPVELEENALLNEKCFQNIIGHLFELINEENTQPIQLLELIAKMIFKMSKYLLIFWKVDIYNKNIKIKKETIDNSFYIENTILVKLLQMVLLNNGKNYSIKLKSYLVKILINLLPHPKIYQFYLNNEEKFFSKIYTCLRNTNDYNLAKLIFKLLFNIIFFNENAINELIDKKKLQTFLALISSSSTIPLVTSGLYFLSKMLTINDYVRQKKKTLTLINSKHFSKKMSKIVNKTHAIFIDFFYQNFMFVKLNMVFMKYIKDTPINNQNPFVCSKLFQAYNIILTKPFCQKILKNNKKKEQYKEGIHFFENLCIGKNMELDLFKKSNNNNNNINTNNNNNNNNFNSNSNNNKYLDKKNSKSKFKRWFNKN
ncbi:nnp-1 protein putative nuclear protein 1 nop52 [Anaeramoeba flamelloides]|uniref:Nnp-1 protein putative nuclear protein 1 nop52 n=1 Tax=Anaeramoeba flamelloides TaxID=1746091 RepID=A0AAV7ZW57_9EUKA|nr:nnp-1 protein putative nuclear protein 1 nop52 [Anaeramoeba flamelloides]